MTDFQTTPTLTLLTLHSDPKNAHSALGPHSHPDPHRSLLDWTCRLHIKKEHVIAERNLAPGRGFRNRIPEPGFWCHQYINRDSAVISYSPFSPFSSLLSLLALPLFSYISLSLSLSLFLFSLSLSPSLSVFLFLYLFCFCFVFFSLSLSLSFLYPFVLSLSLSISLYLSRSVVAKGRSWGFLFL